MAIPEFQVMTARGLTPAEALQHALHHWVDIARPDREEEE
jgi:hypothetical protein